MREMIDPVLGPVLYAETFDEFMAPDIHWITPEDFARAFHDITGDDDMPRTPEAAFTKPGAYPGYVNVKFEQGKAILSVRGDSDSEDQVGATVSIGIGIEDWDQWIASVLQVRAVTLVEPGAPADRPRGS